MVRFIHCADLHFDRSFEGISVIDRESAHLITFNQKTLQMIVTHAIEEAVDFVLFAGDTFHQNKPTLKTQRHFFEQMIRLEQASIPVYLSFGNHDYYDETRYWFDFPKNVHLFKKEQVETIEGKTREGQSYAISAFSYESPWIEQSKVTEFPARQKVDYHIGMYHGEIGKNKYAPFQPSEMIRKGYDYWALGHIHVPTMVNETPPIVYPGTPIGHTKKEINLQGVLLVELNKYKQPLLKPISVETIRWMVVDCSLKNVSSLKEVISVLKEVVDNEQSTQGLLIKINVKDTEKLPKNWLTPLEKKELIFLLNEGKTQEKKWVYDLEEQSISEEQQIALVKAKEEELHNIQQRYEEELFFYETLSELLTQPALVPFVHSSAFKAEVLTIVSQRLKREIKLEGGE